MEERIQLILDSLNAAGNIYLDYLSRPDMGTQEKKANDFVTQADKEIESLLSERILTQFEHDSIIQEEHDDIAGTSGFAWVIDPIDGTNNYARRIPDARIQMAIMHEGEIHYGAIYDPISMTLFSARIGMGAYKTNLKDKKTQKLSVSNRSAKQSLVMLTVAVATSEELINTILRNMQDEIGTIRIYGCAAVSFELLAQGFADAFITTIAKPMDMAPGAMIIKEAGGKVLDFEGNDWSLENKNILVGNAQNTPSLLSFVQS